MTKANFPQYDYNFHGAGYHKQRQTDPRIADYVFAELSEMDTVLNVGAGAGSYEPDNAYVVAVEPSQTMRLERSMSGKFPAVNAVAEQLPFDDQSFDAVMAMVTVHHWHDINKGLAELKRVTKHKVVMLTFDPAKLDRHWNVDYFKDVVAAEVQRYPSIADLVEKLAGNATVIPVPVPFDCVDGFQDAFYGKPEAFLKPEVRAAQSAWGFVDKDTELAYVKRLKHDLNSGEWDRKYGHFRKMTSFQGGLSLIVVNYSKK
ncbi:Methyltransferase domain-containing protein [Amphibacillus marinus]|uniref:Methyltransferase domain-containing protein n=2 Tax=Amphibacillus marinus TaxID=872970 RepID=A0A1H8PMW8_9BACI|nr:Methyltransferase domain-containing protein [Amphibacillus marinus]